jgi:hypothetical protein
MLLIRGAMGARRQKLWAVCALVGSVGLWLGACDLNPQPLPPESPSDNSGSGSENNSIDSGVAGFGSSSGGGSSSGSGGSSGSNAFMSADAGAPVASVGDGAAEIAADSGTDTGPEGGTDASVTDSETGDGSPDASLDATLD